MARGGDPGDRGVEFGARGGQRRILAQRRGLDPDRWADVRDTLPLLAQERYYTTLKRGYARGWEPVGFVRNVQTYAELLRWMVPDEAPSAPAGS